MSDGFARFRCGKGTAWLTAEWVLGLTGNGTLAKRSGP